MFQETIASYQSITIQFRRKTCKFITCWNTVSSLKSFIFLFEIFFLWWLDCVCHLITLHLPFLLDLVVQHLVVPSLIYNSEWIAWSNQLLLTVFSYLRICWNLISIPCGTVWHITETMHFLIIFFNSKLVFSANSNFCFNKSVFLPSKNLKKNSGPTYHVLQPDNDRSIPRLPISTGFILPLTKFHWVGSVSPVRLTTNDLNFLLGFFIQ